MGIKFKGLYTNARAGLIFLGSAHANEFASNVKIEFEKPAKIALGQQVLI